MRKIFIAIILALFLVDFSSNLATAEDLPAVEVYQNLSKAVVLIVTQAEGTSRLVGAGSVISKSGRVVTNSHVVVNKNIGAPYSNVRVYFKPPLLTGNYSQDLINGHNAEVFAFDIDLDLAVLEIKAPPVIYEIIELADPEDIKIGEEVLAIGHPEQGGLWTLSSGRVSGEIANKDDIAGKDVYQTDASVNRGNSGGPLLDRRGYLVGINTNIARLSADNLPITGVNFAIKSSVVKNWLETQNILIAYGKKPLHNRPTQMVHKGSEEARPMAVDNKAARMEAGADQDSKKSGKLDKLGNIQEDNILTPKRPYKTNDLYKEVEKDMEGMMEEMRNKSRQND